MKKALIILACFLSTAAIAATPTPIKTPVGTKISKSNMLNTRPMLAQMDCKIYGYVGLSNDTDKDTLTLLASKTSDIIKVGDYHELHLDLPEQYFNGDVYFIHSSTSHKESGYKSYKPALITGIRIDDKNVTLPKEVSFSLDHARSGSTITLRDEVGEGVETLIYNCSITFLK